MGQIGVVLTVKVVKHPELRDKNPNEPVYRRWDRPNQPPLATTTQVRNITGWINWKRAKRNLETKHGLRLGIPNVGTLREKGGNYAHDGTKKLKNPRHIGDKREDYRKKNHP